MNPAIAKRKEMVEFLRAINKSSYFEINQQLFIDQIRDHLSGVCVWSQDENGRWDSSCTIKNWGMIGKPSDNLMSYCPGCGKPIEEKPYTQEGGK